MFLKQDGYVDVDAIKTVVAKLPQNEPVFWLAGMPSEQIVQAGVNSTLPSGQPVDTIQTLCLFVSLFVIPNPDRPEPKFRGWSKII